MIGVLFLEIFIFWLICPEVIDRQSGEPYSSFLTAENLLSIAHNISTVGIAAVGGTLVIITAGIDLSVGSLIALTVVVTGYFLTNQYSIFAAAPAALCAGSLAGFVNGNLIAFLRLPPFIATLGMLSIARGIAFWITGGLTLSGILNHSPVAAFMGNGRILGIPFPVYVMLAMVLAGAILLNRTAIGRWIIGVGGNEEAARLSGVNVRWLKVFVYTLSGFTASVAGILYACRFGYASSTAGRSYELEVIAAVVIGGTSLSGGRGTIVGSLVGAAIMGCLRTGLVTYGVMDQFIELAIGTVIIAAVLIDIAQERITARAYRA